MRYLILTISILLYTSAFAAPNISDSTGVAPFVVWCDADAPASTSSVKPFQHYYYTWTVDADLGNWGTTGKPKNVAHGGIGAFVFEIAGTYTITLSVIDSSTGSTVSAAGDGDTFEITITDPNTVFSGTDTVCYSNTGVFTECPSGATQTTVTDLSTINLTNGDRHLFRRGDSWNYSVTIPSTDGAGPTSIGAYGTCTSPDEQGNCANAPQFTGNAGFVDMNDKQNWRMADLHLVNGPSGSVSGPQADDLRQWTFLRLNIDSATLGWSHYNDSTPMTIDRMAVVDCNVTGGGTNNVFIGAERLFYSGCIVDASLSSHSSRVWQAYKSAITNNRLSGASTTSSDGRHALKLHGPGYSSFGDVNEYCAPANATTCLANRTEFVVVSDNIFGSSGPWPVSIGPQDALTDTDISDVVFERNKIIRDFGTQSPASTDVNSALNLEARLSTLRNNVIDLSHSSSTSIVTGINVWKRAAAQPDTDYNEIINNTIYRSDSGSAHSSITITSDCDGTIVRNNLSVMPLIAETVISDSGTNSTVSNNATGDSAYLVGPDNVSTMSRNYALTTSATLAIDHGADVPIVDDLTGSVRTGAFDIGAYEYRPPPTRFRIGGAFIKAATND